jgi:hypothetical protein
MHASRYYYPMTLKMDPDWLMEYRARMALYQLLCVGSQLGLCSRTSFNETCKALKDRVRHKKQEEEIACTHLGITC